MKRGRPSKYKTAKARIQGKKETRKKWEEKNSKKLKEYQRKWHKANYIPKKDREPASADTSALTERIAALETKVNDIMLDHEELLKDNKKFMDFMNWGKK